MPQKTSQKTSQKNKGKVIEKVDGVIEMVIEKAALLNEKLSENRLLIIKLMIEDPYISKSELSRHVGISENSISRNIEAMRGKYLRRVGPDKGGFGEIIMCQRINLVGRACPVKSNLLPLWHEIRNPIACHSPRCAYRQLRCSQF